MTKQYSWERNLFNNIDYALNRNPNIPYDQNITFNFKSMSKTKIPKGQTLHPIHLDNLRAIEEYTIDIQSNGIMLFCISFNPVTQIIMGKSND